MPPCRTAEKLVVHEVAAPRTTFEEIEVPTALLTGIYWWNVRAGVSICAADLGR
jgi:hypothetical protein